MVDTSSEYIKMCQKAKEIQQKWKPQDWDWVNGVRNGARGNYVLSGYETDGGYYGPYLTYSLTGEEVEIEGVEDSIWLPRQDQLQEMVDLPIDTLWIEFETWVDIVAIYGVGDYRLREYKTWEQLWFAFTMDKKFGKSWNGEDWVSKNMPKKAGIPSEVTH